MELFWCTMWVVEQSLGSLLFKYIYAYMRQESIVVRSIASKIRSWLSNLFCDLGQVVRRII